MRQKHGSMPLKHQTNMTFGHLTNLFTSMLSFLKSFAIFSAQYKFAAWLYGHRDAINVMAISPSGKFLMSGCEYLHMVNCCELLNMELQGSDGVRLWDVNTYTQLMSPHQNLIMYGPISCMMWITREEHWDEALCCGTGLCYLNFWRINSQYVSRNSTIITASSDSSGESTICIECIQSPRPRLKMQTLLQSLCPCCRMPYSFWWISW